MRGQYYVIPRVCSIVVKTILLAMIFCQDLLRMPCWMPTTLTGRFYWDSSSTAFSSYNPVRAWVYMLPDHSRDISIAHWGPWTVFIVCSFSKVVYSHNALSFTDPECPIRLVFSVERSMAPWIARISAASTGARCSLSVGWSFLSPPSTLAFALWSVFLHLFPMCVPSFMHKSGVPFFVWRAI